MKFLAIRNAAEIVEWTKVLARPSAAVPSSGGPISSAL